MKQILRMEGGRAGGSSGSDLDLGALDLGSFILFYI